MSDANAASRSPASEAGAPAAPRRRRGWRFKLAAVFVGLLPFLLLELGLRAFGYGRPAESLDPFFGFSKLHSQFTKDGDKGKYVTSKSRQLFFGTQEFAAEKPAHGFRAFCLGGSTVRGRPYTTQTAFARWMQVELAAGDSATQYEIVNCGGLSYASYRLMPILHEVLEYEPDLIVIAAGHNEFLEDRTYRDVKGRSETRRWIEDRVYSLRTVTLARQMWRWAAGESGGRTELPEELKTRLDNRSGYASYHRDPQWRKDVIAHYDRSLRKMVAMCRAANVPVVLVRLGANLRDCPPFKPEHKSGLSAAELRRWQQLFDRATEAESSDLESAIALYRKAEQIDGDHARLCYRLARCFDRLRRYEEAARYYRRAKDRDVCPVRILDEMADVVATIAKETGTPLVDAKSLFESQSPQGIPGSNFYIDHVHPTIGAQQQIAQAIVRTAHKENWLPKSFSACTAAARRAAYRRHFESLGQTYIGGARERVNWVEGWAQRDRFLKETLPVDLRGRLDYGHRWFELGDEQTAWREYAALLKDAPGTAAKLLDLALDLVREGRTVAAREMLDKLQTQTGGDVAARITLAKLVVALDTGDEDAVVALLESSAGDLGQVTADDPWLKLMPDALERAKRIAESRVE